MQNIKMNVHDHMTGEEIKMLSDSFYTLANAYEYHVAELLRKYPIDERDEAIWKEIKRARREIKKAEDMGTQWGERYITSLCNRGHYDSDHI